MIGLGKESMLSRMIWGGELSGEGGGGSKSRRLGSGEEEVSQSEEKRGGLLACAKRF